MNQTYIVKAGDTLYGISNQFGVSVTELAELNNIKGSNLKVGTILKIPTASGTNPNNMFMYTVKAGDNLYSIAKKYGTSVQAIKDLNYLKSDNLVVGQQLRIPETYINLDDTSIPNYVNYTVLNGDTLYSIAKMFNVSVDTIIKDNTLNNNNLRIGQNLKIRIPSSGSTEIEECIGEEYTPPVNSIPTTIYTVKNGDNLYSIANRFNTSVNTIKSLNGLISNNLSIGQQLKIPVISDNENLASFTTYTVKSGDSLYSIAKKFNTNVDAIKSLNNLMSNSLSIGKQLKIPSVSSSSDTYIVKSGESLYSIAKKFNTTVDAIKRKNNLTTNNLSIGQKLII